MIDSLRVKYKKNVVEFSRTISINPECRETFRIFYTHKGEMNDEIVWSKEVLDNNEYRQIIIAGHPYTYELFIDNNKTDSIVIPKIYTLTSNDKLVFINNGYTYSPVGFIKNNKFIKLQPKQYGEYSVQKWAEPLIENDEELIKFLKIKYGDYLTY